MNEHQTVRMTDKGVAYLAAINAGLIREGEAEDSSAAAFNRFWTEYTEKSSRNFEKVMQSSAHSMEKLIQMLQAESRERADKTKSTIMKTH